MTTPIRILATTLALAATSTAHAVQPLAQHDVVLLQKGEIIEQRVDGGADAMAAYLKTLGAAETETMRANPSQIPSAGFIVVAVRPGNQTRTWFDFKPALAEATMTALRRTVETTPTMTVKSGEIVFALRVSVWSDKPPTAYAPAPQEWKDATKGMKPKPDVDTLVDMVWPQ
ncbi:hypothetical protein [Scleromatobacter humisilvae]|uniref:Uncharacterized protein n=1 Tax=Scleromatobacter humisilvae TaxID=2897159 RepID=A0A9X1YR56_9BURK|nr:hypothetical protein [Scleromatobacter humisilvae]MCK9686871.1 hypothetical protein [Scleromatobacter humisilvae]